MVDCHRPVFSVGPSAALRLEGSIVPPPLAWASRSVLSSGSSLGVDFLFPFLIGCSRSIARSSTTTGVSVNSQSMGSACFFFFF